MALRDDEIRLIARLTVDARETAARFRRQSTVILVGSLVVAAIAALRAIWFLVPVCVLFGAGIRLLGRAAANKSSSERSDPVLAALRDAPERVQTIVHHETSDSHRMFVSHWVVVTTADGQLRVRADDWEALIDKLRQRCPDAQVKLH